MRIHVVPKASSLRLLDLSGLRVVVIDALRASSTIAQATASGCRRIIPVSTVKEALARRAAAGPGRPLLGGERRGLQLPGFDLGNSPREYTPEAVGGRDIILTTTNGTRALRACRQAREAVVGAFLNLTAVVTHLAAQKEDLLLVAVGRGNAPVLDDLVCAGMYVERLVELAPGCVLTDEAHQARLAYQGYRGRVHEALQESASGRALIKAGLGADLAYCARVGVLDVVPRLVGEEVRGLRPGEMPCP